MIIRPFLIFKFTKLSIYHHPFRHIANLNNVNTGGIDADFRRDAMRSLQINLSDLCKLQISGLQ